MEPYHADKILKPYTADLWKLCLYCYNGLLDNTSFCSYAHKRLQQYIQVNVSYVSDCGNDIPRFWYIKWQNDVYWATTDKLLTTYHNLKQHVSSYKLLYPDLSF